DGRNVRIDVRWGTGDAGRNRRHAAELVELAPDVILASGGSIVAPLLQVTSTVPIVFTQTPDPVGAGFVESLARPGCNATGFSIFDYSLGGTWLELLKEVAALAWPISAHAQQRGELKEGDLYINGERCIPTMHWICPDNEKIC